MKETEGKLVSIDIVAEAAQVRAVGTAASPPAFTCIKKTIMKSLEIIYLIQHYHSAALSLHGSLG